MQPNDTVKWYDLHSERDRSGILVEHLRIEGSDEYAWEVQGDDGRTYLVEENVLQTAS